MRSEVDELKRFAIADILSVSGKQKTTETINMHINTIIDIAFLKGQQAQQSKVDELQAKFDQHDQWLGHRNKDVQELNDIIAKHVTEKDELQKRVDAAQELFDDWNCGGMNLFDLLDALEQTLKGGDE